MRREQDPPASEPPGSKDLPKCEPSSSEDPPTSEAPGKKAHPASEPPGTQEPPEGNLLRRFVALNVAGTATTTLIGFGTSIALARWLGPANRGLLALMFSVSWIALMLGGIGVPWATIYLSAKPEASPAALFGNSLLHAGVLAAVLIPAAALLQQPLSDAFGHGHGGEAWVLAALLVPVTFLNWTTHGQLQGMLLFGRYNLLNVLSKVAEALCILILLGVLGLGVGGGLIACIAASVVMVLGALRPILASGRPRFQARLMGTMLRYGVRVQVGSIFQTLTSRLDLVILQFFQPLAQVGYYTVAQIIAEVVLQLAGAFQSSIMPLASRYADHEQRQATASADSARHYGILAGVGLLAVAAAGPLVIRFLYGSRIRGRNRADAGAAARHLAAGHGRRDPGRPERARHAGDGLQAGRPGRRRHDRARSRAHPPAGSDRRRARLDPRLRRLRRRLPDHAAPRERHSAPPPGGSHARRPHRLLAVRAACTRPPASS